MSFGGWVSGVIFDATGSHAAAFLNGVGWNALNITIMTALLSNAVMMVMLSAFQPTPLRNAAAWDPVASKITPETQPPNDMHTNPTSGFPHRTSHALDPRAIKHWVRSNAVDFCPS